MKPQKSKRTAAPVEGKPVTGALPGWLIPVGTALLLYQAIRIWGMIQFGGEDGSALLQAAWRYYIGQKPYVDSFIAAPPAYVVIPGLAFRLFGVAWSSMVIIDAIYAAGAFLFQYYLFRELRFPRMWSWVICFATQCVTMLPLSWWYYNQTTTVAATLFVPAACLLLLAPRRWQYRASFVITMVMLSWTKANVAGFLLVGMGVVFLVHRPTRMTFLGCTAAALALSVGAMVVTGVNPADMLHAYFQSSGRLSNVTMLARCLYTVAKDEATLTFLLLMPLAIALLLAARMPPRGQRVFLAVGVLSICTGLVAMATNNELNSQDAPLVFIGVILILFNPARLRESPGAEGSSLHEALEPRQLPAALTLAAMGFFTLFGMLFCLSRYPVETIGEGSFYQDAFLQKMESPSLFKGVQAAPRLFSVIDEIEKVFAQTNALTEYRDSIFFGPRIEFGYPAYQITPLKGLFVFWPGTGEGSEEQIRSATASFIAWRPRLCIFLRNDFTYIPFGILQFLSQNYKIENSDNLTILTLKQ